jgi:hypothetical protein
LGLKGDHFSEVSILLCLELFFSEVDGFDQNFVILVVGEIGWFDFMVSSCHLLD